METISNSKKILEQSNELISKFIGCTYNKNNRFEVSVTSWSKPFFWTDKFQNAYGFCSYKRTNEMLYNSSLDWIAPVTKMLERELYKLSSEWKGVDKRHSELASILEPLTYAKMSLDSEEIYKATVEAIKWYNKNIQVK